VPAHPFGGHPTLARYIEWARENHCDCQSGYGTDEDGRTQPLIRIVAPSKKWVILTGVRQTDYLVPSIVGYLDRRLGLVSPFFSVDDPTLDL
jgi:hypothetical protein